MGKEGMSVYHSSVMSSPQFLRMFLFVLILGPPLIVAIGFLLMIWS